MDKDMSDATISYYLYINFTYVCNTKIYIKKLWEIGDEE